MPLLRLLALCSSLLLLSACGGADELDARAGGAAGVEPTPAEPDDSAIAEAMRGLELTSAVEDSGMEDATPSRFAMLTEGSGPKEDREEPEVESKPKTRFDPGLGKPGGRTLTGGQVQTGIRPKLPQVRACYEKELKKGGEFRGRVVVAWTIGADGNVRAPRIVSDSTGNRAMLPCITRVVSRWQFEKAESPTDIEYPFRFKPSAGF